MAPVRAHPLMRVPDDVGMYDQFRGHLGMYPDDELISELLRRKRINWLTNSQSMNMFGLLHVNDDRAEHISCIRKNMAAQVGTKLLEGGYMRFSQEEDPVTYSLRLTLRLPALTFTKS